MNKPYNNKAWLGVLPVLLIVAFSGVIPLMTVVNYSVQDILDFNSRFFVGFQWYTDTLQDPGLLTLFCVSSVSAPVFYCWKSRWD